MQNSITRTIAKEMGVPLYKEGLIFLPGGRLVETRHCYDESINKVNYQYFDVSENATRLLMHNILFHPEIKLKDLFIFIQRNSSLFNIIVNKSCEALCKIALTNIKIWKNNPSNDNIAYLELFRFMELPNNSGQDCEVGRIYFHGVGYTNKLNTKPQCWDVSFTPINEISDIPLRLNYTFEVTIDNKITEYSHENYKLLEIINTIIHDLYNNYQFFHN